LGVNFLLEDLSVLRVEEIRWIEAKLNQCKDLCASIDAEALAYMINMALAEAQDIRMKEANGAPSQDCSGRPSAGDGKQRRTNVTPFLDRGA
jgi:hypothetical protein